MDSSLYFFLSLIREKYHEIQKNRGFLHWEWADILLCGYDRNCPESSANSLVLELSFSGKWLIKSRKSSSPSTAPWGTWLTTSVLSYKDHSTIVTLCVAY